MFKRAQRKAAKLRLALVGPSGSGKTYSGLLIAKGLGGRVALIDTERGSGELYSHLYEYDAAQLNPPFSPEKYIAAIHEAEQAGYDVLVIDSLSHAWSGEGGVLDLHDRAAKSVRNSFAAWREVTPQHNALVDVLLASPCHVIVTMRTKTAYEVQNEGGKTKVAKVGLAPVQRDGLEYEFTLVLDIAIEGHIATAAKDRTGLFDGKHFVPDESIGQELKSWLESGAKVESGAPLYAPPAAPAGNHDMSFYEGRVFQMLEQLGIGDMGEAYSAYVCARYGVADIALLGKKEFNEQLALLRQCLGKKEKLEQFVEILNQQKTAA